MEGTTAVVSGIGLEGARGRARRHLVLACLAACGGGRDEPAPPVARAAVSSVAARDYIGPEACGECHPDQYGPWRASLHAVMNQRADASALIGDFETTVAYAGGEVRFEMAAQPAMTFARGGSLVRYRVTRTIGRRGLQEYVGVEDGGPGHEVRLPFGWWPRGGGWVPQPYFDPWLEEDELDPFAPVREPWAERCPWCHSTYPFELRVARASAPRGLGHGLEQHFASAPGSDRLAVEQQITAGISCESCHLGGRAHAAGAPISFVPLGVEPRPGAPAATAFASERRDPAIVAGVCAQCHSGPSPRLADGTALRNSSESLDLAASPCATIRCTDCHDPHRGGADCSSASPFGGAARSGEGGPCEATAVAACTGCHASVAPHAGSGHGGVTCLDCHMPRIVMGIDRFVRTHRISSPGGRALAAANACSVCHLDRSFAWVADELRLRHHVNVAGGDPESSAGEAWLASPRPSIRLIAAAAYARSPLGRYAIPELARGLDDPLAYVRAWTKLVLEELLGRTLDIDVRSPPDVRRKQLAKLRL